MKKAIVETERHRLPSFDCPNPDCRAKHIAFATSRETKNETELVPIDNFTDATEADFVIVCPKCCFRQVKSTAKGGEKYSTLSAPFV